MHTYDRMFFDPSLGNGTNGAGYTVDKWLADLNTRYGKIDRVIMWCVIYCVPRGPLHGGCSTRAAPRVSQIIFTLTY